MNELYNQSILFFEGIEDLEKELDISLIGIEIDPLNNHSITLPESVNEDGSLKERVFKLYDESFPE